MKLTDTEVLEVLRDAQAWHRGDKWRNSTGQKKAARNKRNRYLRNAIKRQSKAIKEATA